MSTAPHDGPRRAAVIGCGAISHQHLAFLRDSQDALLVSVCDRSAATARFAQDRYGAGSSHLDVSSLLATEDLDVVHVLTPPQLHAAIISECLDAGVHVVCEKPLAPDARTARSLVERAAELDLVLVESRNLLWNDPVLAIDTLVQDGSLGEVREVDVLLSLDLTAGPFGDLNLAGPGVDLPGGAVHDFLPHLAYLFLHFADGCGSQVDGGSLDNLSGNPRVGFDHLDALVRAGTVRGRLRVASDLAPDQFRLWVRGTDGTVETDFYNPFMRLEGGRDVGKRAPLEQLRSGARLGASAFTNLRDKVLQHSTYHGLPRMLGAIYSALRSGSEPPISGDDIIATATFVDQIVELAGGDR